MKANQFEYLNQIEINFTSNGFGQGGFSGKNKPAEVQFFWILSGETPTPLKRGVWTDDGVWNSTAVWLG
jgi:hypothetical protein